MRTIAAHIAIAVISGLNALTVFVVSILGVYGDGSVGAMPLIQKVGWVWVGGFTVVAFYLAAKGQLKAGIVISAKAIPYGILLFIGGLTLWALIKSRFQ